MYRLNKKRYDLFLFFPIDEWKKEVYIRHMNKCSYVQRKDDEKKKEKEKEINIMQKKFKLLNLDCAHCAAKMENEINKLDGVEQATISFMTQKLTIKADDERFDEIVKEAAAICHKIEPDCEIVAK